MSAREGLAIGGDRRAVPVDRQDPADRDVTGGRDRREPQPRLLEVAQQVDHALPGGGADRRAPVDQLGTGEMGRGVDEDDTLAGLTERQRGR